MSCKHQALIIYTRTVKGTSSNLASGRIQISCSEPDGHDGPHRNAERDETWNDRGDLLTHILRSAEEGEG